MGNKKRMKGIAAAVVIAVVAVMAGTRVMGGGDKVLYDEVPVETRDITTYLEFSGNVEAVNVMNVYPGTSAKVTEVLVAEGDEVKKGDIIALLDSGDTEYNIALKEKSLELTKLQNSYNIKDSQMSLDNLKQQVENGENSSLNSAQKSLLSAQQNYQDAADTYNRAKAEYDTETADSIVSAKEQLRTAELNYNLNITNLDHNKEETENLGQEAYNYDAQRAVYENSLAQAKEDLKQAKETVKKQVDDYYDAFIEAQTALLDAEKDYETASLGVEQNIATSNETLEKTTALANVESSELELAHLKESLADFTIYAPMDGFVTELGIKAGESVATNLSVAEITDLNTMQASIRIDEYDVGQVHTGDEVEIYINALDKTFNGRIASIAKKAVVQSDVSYLEAVVEFNAEDEVSSGLSAEIKLVKADEKGVAALPVEAVLYDTDNTAYVLKKGADGEPVKTQVVLGVSDGNYVQVADGVNSGDIVLTTVKTAGFGMPQPGLPPEF